jgi:hypothetical protein
MPALMFLLATALHCVVADTSSSWQEVDCTVLETVLFETDEWNYNCGTACCGINVATGENAQRLYLVVADMSYLEAPYYTRAQTTVTIEACSRDEADAIRDELVPVGTAIPCFYNVDRGIIRATDPYENKKNSYGGVFFIIGFIAFLVSLFVLSFKNQ